MQKLTANAKRTTNNNNSNNNNKNTNNTTEKEATKQKEIANIHTQREQKWGKNNNRKVISTVCPIEWHRHN